MTSISSIIESFFFSQGITSLFALLCLLILLIGFTLLWRYAGIFTMVLCIYIANEYIGQLSASGDFAWHLLLIMLTMVFSMLRVSGVLDRNG